MRCARRTVASRPGGAQDNSPGRQPWVAGPEFPKSPVGATGVLRAIPEHAHEKHAHGARPLRRGFSLFEVILALGIMAGAVVVLGELARLGAENARLARDLTQAHLLCESKLAEILAGLAAAESSDGEVLSTSDLDDQEWLCSVEVEPMDTEKMLVVKVTVLQNLPDANNPVQCTLTRWMPDPNATYSQTTTEDTSTDTEPSSSSSTTPQQ